MAVHDLPTYLSQCSDMQDDLDAIGDWSTIFLHPIRLTKTVTKNVLENPVKLDKDIKKSETDLDTGDYYDFGEDIADILTLAVGPVQVPDYIFQ